MEDRTGPGFSRGSALTGNFDVDFYASKVEHAQISDDSVRTEMPKRYSPVTAGLLSAVCSGCRAVLHTKLLAKHNNIQR